MDFHFSIGFATPSLIDETATLARTDLVYFPARGISILRVEAAQREKRVVQIRPLAE